MRGLMLLWVGLAGASHPSAQRGQGAEAEIATEILWVGHVLERAIRTRDVPGILQFVEAKGILCVDAWIPKARVEKDLRDPKSWLHAYLFDATQFNARHRQRHEGPSLAEFWSRGVKISSKVNFTANDLGMPCITYRAANFDAEPYFCFGRFEGRWVITGSLYPCG